MGLDDTINMSNVSEPPPLLLPEAIPFNQYLEKTKQSQPNSTTVYYYLNDEDVPFKIEVPVHPSKLTLAYLKCALNKQNFKCYVTQLDSGLQREVKAEITDDYALIKPNNRGLFELFLLVNEPSADLKTGGTMRTTRKKRILPTSRHSANLFHRPMPPGFTGRRQQSSSIYHNLEMQRQRNNRRPCRAIMSDESTKFDDNSPLLPKKYFLRNYASDSETSADFTSVSEMEEKYRSRKRRGSRMKRARSHSFTSTCEDTEVSVGVELITVELNLNSCRDFGMNVIVRKTPQYHGIYVGSIEPNSVVALDGRIKPNQLIIEVNGFPLDNYTCDDAIAILKNEVADAARRRGTVILTLSENTRPKKRELFQLPDESVRPLDTECWRDTVNMCYNISLNPDRKLLLPQIPPNPKDWCGVVTSTSGSTSNKGGKAYNMNMPMEEIVGALADPCIGLNRRNVTQLNLTISDGFTGQDLINWLADNVVGLEDRKSCEKYCGQLLRQGFIEQNFKKNSFTAQCYYTLNEAKLQSLGHLHQNTMKRGVLTPIDINMPAMDDTQITKKKSGNMSKIRRLFCLSSNQRKKF